MRASRKQHRVPRIFPNVELHDLLEHVGVFDAVLSNKRGTVLNDPEFPFLFSSNFVKWTERSR